MALNCRQPTLYLVATPLGNLKDISLRALEILKKVDLILCEDTRVTKKLLNHYHISTPTASYHQHTRLKKIQYILKELKKNKNLALVSDAGTPSISDPGGRLVDYLLRAFPEIRIVPVPGPSALIAALSVAGLPADKFIFLGFPPAKRKRKAFFKKVALTEYTVVFYESSHRIIKTLNELADIFKREGLSGLPLVVCRELTKKFETIYRGTLRQILQQLDKNAVKGEFVVVVGRKQIKTES